MIYFCFVTALQTRTFLTQLHTVIFIYVISEELKNAQNYTKDFKQQILDLRGTLYPSSPSHLCVEYNKNS